MTSEARDLSILIFLTCQAKPFSPEFVDCVKQWLELSRDMIDHKVNLNFTNINVIKNEIPNIDVLKKYDGIVVTGSYSSVNENHGWMQRLCHVMRLCYAHEIPVFCICFGFQLLSYALGSSYSVSPHGFIYGVNKHHLTDEALEYLKPHIQFCLKRREELGLTITNGVVHTEDSNIQYALFSHNDIVSSVPNIDNIDYGNAPEEEISFIKDALLDLKFINISKNEYTPVVGLIMGNSKKYFILSVQMHPEFETPNGQSLFARILDLKCQEGVTTRDLVKERMRHSYKSNTRYIYGRMALLLFINKHI